MEHERVAETLHELAEFAKTTGRTLQSHREVLQRHESILLEAFESGMSHKQAIEGIQKNLEDMRQLLSAQSALVSSLERALRKVLSAIDMMPPEDLEPVN